MNIFRRIYKQPSYFAAFIIGIIIGIKDSKQVRMSGMDLKEFLKTHYRLEKLIKQSNIIGNCIWLVLIGILIIKIL